MKVPDAYFVWVCDDYLQDTQGMHRMHVISLLFSFQGFSFLFVVVFCRFFFLKIV